MLKGIELLCHSSIRIEKEQIIYIDPFKIEKNYMDADIIYVTHDHYDHFSEEDILKVKKENTIIVLPKELNNKAKKLGFKDDDIIEVDQNIECEINGIKIKTIPAYNVNKKFHPQNNNWVGYILEIDGIKYYIAGDTDLTEENSKVKCDVALIPIGGTYTMDYKEAAELVNIIKPKIVVPIHYGSIVGNKEDADKFRELVNSDIECKIMIK